MRGTRPLTMATPEWHPPNRPPQLSKGDYRSANDVLEEMQRLFSNARYYNEPWSAVYKAAVRESEPIRAGETRR